MSEDTNRIIEYPENYKEMVEKLQEREEEQLKKVLAKRKAESTDELKEIAGKAIAKRMVRTSKEHKPLKDRTIITEAKSNEVGELKKQLNEELTSLAQEVFKKLPGELPSLSKKLQGRVKPKTD